MKTLSKTGKTVARRSFAALMAVLLCATSLGTNFWGLGNAKSESIVGGFEAFAADNVNYVPSKTYYDAGTLTMNAYYDATTGNKLNEDSANYHATDWDVTNATSYVASATQNGNKGITILSTTDVASAGKHGSASNTVAGGDGKNGIMCFSEYLKALNGGLEPGQTGYEAYEKSVPDYEAPAGNDTVTYQYMAEGKTSTTADGQVEIKWTLLAWPNNQGEQTATQMKNSLDTAAEIEAEWAKTSLTSKTGQAGVVLDVPGELINNSNNAFQNAGLTNAKDNTSLFWAGQPVWLSGNKGSFDSWIENGKENYLMNLGLWSRIETSAVKLELEGNQIIAKGTPAVFLAGYAPNNTATTFIGASYKLPLSESNDTENAPLYAYINDTYGTEDKLEDMSMSNILSGQNNLSNVVIPTYNIRKQLHAIWNATRTAYLKNADTLTCRKVTDGSTSEKAFGTVKVTGTRLYAIASLPRIDADYANTNKSFINASTEGTFTTDITKIDQWVSAAQNGKFYGESKTGATPVKFVFDKNDISDTTGVVHINNIPDNVFNLSDIYQTYDTYLTGSGTIVADDVANTLVPYLIRSDAYYDVTEDYQRAAGVLYGRTDAATLQTSALNEITNSKTALPNASDTIIDTVTYSGLNAGETYVLTAKVYKNDDAGFAQSSPPNGTAEFTATASSGTQEVVIELDSSAFNEGDRYVVTEVLTDAGNNVIAEHKDLTDAAQTITYTMSPVVATKAELSDEDSKITDSVTYTGLDADTNYTMNASVFDKTTGRMTDITATVPFITDATGAGKLTVELTEYDATAYIGHTLVVYEEIKDGTNHTAAEHKDQNDELQTVVVGANIKVSTTAKSATGSKYLDAIDSESISDEVSVSGLKANTEYMTKATLYDITTGALVTDASGNVLSWTGKVTTDASGAGKITVTINNFFVSDKAGHTLVVYEDILVADGTGVPLVSHADNTDEDQTVTVKKAGITTVLTDKDGEKDMESSASMIFKDEITYSELVPNNKYYMVSTLVDKTTGTVLKDSSGNEAVVKSTVFNANSTGSNKGSASFTFTNMVNTMSGKTVVAYNDLYRVTDNTTAGTTVTDAVKAQLVASEHDLTNIAQTVAIDATLDVTEATIKTVAKSKDDTKEIPLSTHAVIKDKVSYTGLKGGKTYTLTADVYDTSTGQRAAGFEKVKTLDFAAADSGKGDVIMTIDINTMDLTGHKLVVYESLTLGDIKVAAHRDLTDKDQTVTVNNTFEASIDTVATDKVTGGKTIMATSDAVILDKVSYDGLNADQEYILTASVYDKSTGKKTDVKEVETTFKPKESDGSVEVSIPIDGTKFTGGQSLVVYEKLTTKVTDSDNKDKKKTVTVAKHNDISDADQTVTFVKMSTYLTGDGTSAKTVHVGADAYTIDTASFTGLTSGRTYVIVTQLVDVAANAGAVTLDTTTNNNTSASGSVVATRTMEFTPTTSNGSIATQVNVNTTNLSGHSLVAIATVTDKSTGKVVAEHNDKSNIDQTITVQTRVEAQTGVGSMTWFFGILLCIMFSACASYGIGLYSDTRRKE